MSEGQKLYTLCIECAKHPSVKKFVADHQGPNETCGVCGRTSPALPVCSSANLPQLANLVRALIRLFYDEWDYNPHWGGDLTPEGILKGENSIIQNFDSFADESDEDRLEVLIDSLFTPPYPNPETGISVYAGFDDGIRHCSYSLQNRHWDIIEFERRLLRENYFEVEPEVRSRLLDLANDIEAFVERGDEYTRARIGVKKHFRPILGGFRPEILHQPYSMDQIAAPPPQLATAGRLNRSGVSYLYLASDAATAAAEVRPHPGHLLSTAKFHATRRIRIADFSADIARFCMSENRLNKFHFIHSIDTLMSTPVVPEEGRRHTLSQLIADVVRQIGFEGVRYRSSVAQGTNLCVLAPQTFEPRIGSENVLRVEGLAYTTSQAPILLNPAEDHRPIEQ